MITFWENEHPSALQVVEININPQLFLDTLLMEIRGETIKYGAKIKRERGQKEQFLSQKIELLEMKVNQNPPDIATSTSLQEAKLELEEINKIQTENSSIKSRAIYGIHGEKPSRMFCNLTKNQGIQKFIPFLIVTKEKKEQVISKQEEIEQETKNYYQTLYSSHEHKRTTNTIDFWTKAPLMLKSYQQMKV